MVAAEQDALAALGLSSSLDLTALDPIAGTISGDADSAAAFIASAKVIDTVHAIAAAFDHGAGDFGPAFTDAYTAIVSDVVAGAEGVNASLFVSDVSANRSVRVTYSRCVSTSNSLSPAASLVM